MATIEQISTLLDAKFALLDAKFAPVNAKLSLLSQTVGSLVEANMRDEARRMFGESFAKNFVIRSLYDAVHLLTKAKFAGLVPSAVRERSDAAIRLARTARTLAIPLAKAARLSYTKRLGTVESAEEAFDEGDYSKALGILISQARLSAGDSSNIVLFLKRIKKAFPSDQTGEEDDLKGLLSCEGPGVMLVELASRYTAAELEVKEDLFDDLHELVEMDLRGTITLVGTHATVACGEAKSSWSGLSEAKKQLKLRTRFLKTVVNVVFPNKFSTFVLIGHVFVPTHSTAAERQIPDNGVADGVSIYIHVV